jgi:hypothetical protein
MCGRKSKHSFPPFSVSVSVSFICAFLIARFIFFLFQLLTVELLQSFGICLLLFRVLPTTDFFRGITITMATFQVPALLKLLLAERKFTFRCWHFFAIVTSVLALAAQVLTKLLKLKWKK